MVHKNYKYDGEQSEHDAVTKWTLSGPCLTTYCDLPLV
jgi:hypothetical protein